MKAIQLNPKYLESLKSRQSKHKFYWQSQAEELSTYYGKPLYWLFHKFPAEEIMAEYQYRKEKGDKDPQFFIRILQSKQKKKTMTRESLLEEMREDYRTRNIIALKKHYFMGQWLLNEEDKMKILAAIKNLEEEALHPMVKEALKILGGRIVS